MQTIKITITSPADTNIVLKENTISKSNNIKEKLRRLLNNQYSVK